MTKIKTAGDFHRKSCATTMAQKPLFSLQPRLGFNFWSFKSRLQINIWKSSSHISVMTWLKLWLDQMLSKDMRMGSWMWNTCRKLQAGHAWTSFFSRDWSTDCRLRNSTHTSHKSLSGLWCMKNASPGIKTSNLKWLHQLLQYSNCIIWYSHILYFFCNKYTYGTDTEI